MAVTDLSVLPVAQLLLDCFAAEVALVDAPPAVTSLRVGQQVELLLAFTRDECCEGVGWVRVATIYPSSTFPAQDTEWSPCAPAGWAAVLEMGVARCAPTPDASSIPSADEWSAIATAVLEDAAAMRRAICCFDGTDGARRSLAGLWTPLPVEGGCVGGTQQLTVSIGDCDCDDEAS